MTDSEDFVPISRTLTFQSGERTVRFPVMALVDQVDELREQFSLVLSNPNNDAALGSSNTATVFIEDTNSKNSMQL